MHKVYLPISLILFSALTGCSESTKPVVTPVPAVDSTPIDQPTPQQAQEATSAAAAEVESAAEQADEPMVEPTVSNSAQAPPTSEEPADLAKISELTSYVPPKINTELSAEKQNVDEDALSILRNDAQPETIYVLLEHDSAEVRRLALQTIHYRWLNKGQTAPFAKIIDRISDPNLKVAEFATKFFMHPGPHIEAALPALVWATKQEYERSSEAYYALNNLGPAAAPLVPYLIQVISEKPADGDTEAWDRVSSAIQLLGSIGPKAIRAEEALKPYLSDITTSLDLSNTLAQIGATDTLLTYIESKGDSVGSLVLVSLGDLPEPDPRAIKVLTHFAKHSPYASTRAMSIHALAQLAPNAPEAIEIFVAAMKDTQGDVRAEAAAALGILNPQPKQAVTLLIQAMKDEDEDVREAAISALGDSKSSPAERFQALLEAGAKGDMETAYNVEMQFLNPDKHLQNLLEVIRDPKQPEAQRAFAAVCFELYSQEIWEVHRPEFEKLLEDKQQPVSLRGAVALVLHSHQIRDSLVMETLVEGAQQKVSPTIRERSIELLKDVEDDQAVPILVEAAQSRNLDDRTAAFRSLRKLGPKAALAVPQMITLLNSRSDEVAAEAALVLGKIGAASKPAVPLLIKAAQIENDDLDLPKAAIRALGPIAAHLEDPSPVVDLLLSLMDREQTQQVAIYALGNIGPPAGKAVPRLIPLLDPDLMYLFDAALDALAGMGDAAEPAVDQLLELMGSEDKHVRWKAMETLSQIPVSAERVLPKLRTILKEESDDSTKFRALDAIKAYGPNAKAMIPDLIVELGKDDEFYRSAIIKTLITFGPDAKPAIQPILDAMEGETGKGFTVRNAGIEGLIKIAPQDPRFLKFLVKHGYMKEAPKPGEIQ